MKDEISTQVPKQALRKTDVSGSYIWIEIVDYFGAKKVIEVKPYFDKQQLTEIEFLNAIRLLEEEKNKATLRKLAQCEALECVGHWANLLLCPVYYLELL